MIPRLKPWLGRAELAALAGAGPGEVEAFEAEFARAFGAAEGVAFGYGRVALHALFGALDITGAEVVMPAYTCSVVAHAVMLSGNVPRFVDVSPDDYNMRLDEVAAALGPRTRAVVATHLFGYPLDVDRLREIVRAAEARYGQRIWIVQDCAHAFGARWQGRMVAAEGDAAIFGLNVSKLVTSIFGGMLTTSDPWLAARLRAWRDAHGRTAGAGKAALRRAYLLAAAAAFTRPLYGAAYLLQERTPLLNRLTRAYHLDEKVHFPPDAGDRMLPVEAAVGRVQLGRYAEIVRRRERLAALYHARLKDVPGIVLPPLVEGATYSHFVVRVPDRAAVMRELARHGIQLGQLIEYSLPHLPPYLPYAGDRAYPASLLASRTTVNLPVHASVTEADAERVTSLFGRAVRARPAPARAATPSATAG
jgi:dTDP-4-amino-4,6-dideoxygalactose transaminase